MPLSDRSLGLVIHVKVYVLGSWLKKGNYYVHVYQSNLSLILSKHQDKCWVLVKLNCSLQHHKQQQVLPRLCRELVLSEAPTKLHQNWTIKGYKLVPYTLMRQSGEGRGGGGERTNCTNKVHVSEIWSSPKFPCFTIPNYNHFVNKICCLILKLVTRNAPFF